mmetsp:Transcript_15204/g.17217  ORF Transcript_15204/g.17217 Transcript_15204/m.17217 type:complete len:256 (+) Transcript_15204:57-824(+)
MDKGRYAFALPKPEEIVFESSTKQKTSFLDSSDESGSDSDASSSPGSETEEGVTKTKKQKTEADISFIDVEDLEESDDSDAPLENMAHITSADPAIQKAKMAQALLLKKRQEVIEEHKRLIETEVTNETDTTNLPIISKFTVSESSTSIAERLISCSKKKVGGMGLQGKSGFAGGIKIIFRLPAKEGSRRAVEEKWGINPSAAFEPQLDAFAAEKLKGIDRKKIRFQFDGEELAGSETAENLDMEDDDIVDVKIS